MRVFAISRCTCRHVVRCAHGSRAAIERARCLNFKISKILHNRREIQICGKSLRTVPWRSTGRRDYMRQVSMTWVCFPYPGALVDTWCDHGARAAIERARCLNFKISKILHNRRKIQICGRSLRTVPWRSTGRREYMRQVSMPWVCLPHPTALIDTWSDHGARAAIERARCLNFKISKILHNRRKIHICGKSLRTVLWRSTGRREYMRQVSMPRVCFPYPGALVDTWSDHGARAAIERARCLNFKISKILHSRSKIQICGKSLRTVLWRSTGRWEHMRQVSQCYWCVFRTPVHL
jgi:hypothetical protein